VNLAVSLPQYQFASHRSRKAGFVAAVSNLALIIMAAPDMSFAHEGVKPQRTSDSSRRGSFGFWRMTGTG
jgi:hypothetical protein